MTTKLGGIIFRKALMENNWSKVYETVLVGMLERSEEIEDETHILKAFGDIGG
jgi:hypothetical protein